MRDGALKGIHLKKIRNTLRNEDEDLVEDFLDYMDTRPDLVKEYDDYSDYMVREDFETWKKYKKIKARDVDTYEEVTKDLEKELKDSDTLKNLAYKFAQMGNYFDRANSHNSREILGKEDDKKLPEFYNLGLQVYKQLEQEVEYLKNNKRTNSNRDYGFLSETVSLLEDGADRLYRIKDEKCKLLSKKINDLLYEYKKHTYKDSKVKDSSCTITVLEEILWDDEMRKRTRKYNLDAKKLEIYKFWKSTYGVWVISGDRNNIKKFLKENELAIGKNPEIKDSAKLLNIIKLYKKATKDSKVKDSDEVDIFMKNLNSLMKDNFKLVSKTEYDDFISITFTNMKGDTHYTVTINKTESGNNYKFSLSKKNRYSKFFNFKNDYKRCLEVIKNMI